jgi:hypothetical protein
MSNRFGIPDLPVGDEARATKVVSQQCAHLIIAYPGAEDWLNLYDPRRSRDVHASRESFKTLRDHHFKSVEKNLVAIGRKGSGQAMFAELNAAPNEVIVYPFDFRPASSWGDSSVVATTTPKGMAGNPSSAKDPNAVLDNELHTFRKGIPIPGVDTRGLAVSLVGLGGGGRVAIFYEALRADGGQSPDEALVHEMVHASRKMRGLIHHFPMSGGYRNKEEFLANVVQNIYRSENGAVPVWYGGAPMAKPSSFLNSPISPSPSGVLAMMRNEQKTFFDTLARVNTSFNPIRQVDLESKAYVARIERM